MKLKAMLGIIVLFLLVIGCSSSSNAPPEVSGTINGVTFTPRGFQAEEMADFFLKAKQAGTVVSWAGDWNEVALENGAPAVVATLASRYKYTPVIEVQFFHQDTGKLLRPLEAETKEKYINDLIPFVKKYKPAYLGIGIEVNILYDKSPADFEKFVELYNELYPALKAASPDTIVFTIFQLEQMKGLQGGLFGGKNDASQAQWFLLEKFSSLDIIGFTTYPGLIYHTPMEIPPEYYAEIRSHTSQKIIFTEIGWPSAPYPSGWESSEAEQAEFVTLFWNRMEQIDPQVAICGFLYDPDIEKPFSSLGLFYQNTTAKKAWGAWRGGK